jgi:hypothetical protein
VPTRAADRFVGQDRPVDLNAVADRLYALPVGDFTAERDAQAAAARDGGDRDLATAVKKLRRPTAAAALVNQLVRDDPTAISELLEVGEQLRQAQQDLATDDLRRLSQERRSSVAALVKQAKQLATERGEPATESMLRELRATLDAASADEAAATELRRGHLTKALQYSGFGAGVGAAAEPGPETDGQAERRTTGKAKRVGDLDARRVLREATAAAEHAREEFSAAEHAVSEARLRTEAERRVVMDLEAELLSAREALTTAKQELKSAQRTHAEADQAREQAEKALAKATRKSDGGKKKS